MSNPVDRLKSEVSRFHRQNGVADSPAAAFPAWYLHRKYEVHPKLAAAQSSTGSHDLGVDAFHIEPQTDKGPVLHLVQAKYSESKSAIKQAVRGFERTMQEVKLLLNGQQSEVPALNPVLERLGAALERHQELRSSFRVHFAVAHMCQEPPESIERAVDAARERFIEVAANTLSIAR